MEVKVMKYRFQSENYKILSPSDKMQEDILNIIQEEQSKANSNEILTPEVIYRVGKKVIVTDNEEFDFNNYTLEQVQDFCLKPYEYPQLNMEEVIQELSCAILDVVLNYYRGMQLQVKMQELELVKTSVTSSLDVLQKKSEQVKEELEANEKLIKAMEKDTEKASELNRKERRKQKRELKKATKKLLKRKDK